MTIEERLEALERKAFPERFCEHEWVYGLVPCSDPPNRAEMKVDVVCAKCGVQQSKWDAGDYEP